MENEANKATWLGVTLTIFVVLVAAISVTMVMGRNFGNQYIDKLARVVGISSGELTRLDGTITKQSAASVQLLLSENFSIIDFDESKVSVMLRGDSSFTDLSDIRANAHGDCILEVKKQAGTYIVNVHRHSCNIWKIDGSCSCNSKVRD